jgi:DNA repair protein RadC
MNNIPEITIQVKFDKKVKKSELKVLTSVDEVVNTLRQVFNADTFDWKEEFILLCLNKRNALVGFYKVSSGGIGGTIADPRVIFTTALNCTATSIIIAHNHPSGNLQTSNADDSITKKIKESGEILDIKLLDHIILTDEGYYSYMEEGKL